MRLRNLLAIYGCSDIKILPMLPKCMCTVKNHNLGSAIGIK